MHRQNLSPPKDNQEAESLMTGFAITCEGVWKNISKCLMASPPSSSQQLTIESVQGISLNSEAAWLHFVAFTN